MPYPDKLLDDDEEVVAHLHPHAARAFWPVVRLLVIVGAASFGAALVPAGERQGLLRLVLLGVATVLLVGSVVLPLLRWRATHYVITTRRVLQRSGVLTRRGSDVALAHVTDVSSTQTLADRVIRSGDLRVTAGSPAGHEAVVVLERAPGIERLQALLHHMIEEDLARRHGCGSGPAWDRP